MRDEPTNKNQNDQELYNDFLEETKQSFTRATPFSEEEQVKIVKASKLAARMTNIMISLAILLLILPVTMLLTYIYYGVGGKANLLIDVAAKTIYVTEPNMSLEEMEIEDDIGIFTMHVLFDTYKKIGHEDYRASEYDIYFVLDEPNIPEKNYLLDRPLPDIPSVESETLLHPKASIPYDQKEEWDMLKGLPDGTVAEVYLSLSQLMEPEHLEEIMPDEIELRWLAVDTGLEEKQVNEEGIPISSLGYPAQVDYTTWSPFNGRDKTNEEVFMDILSLLERHEDLAEKVARAKALELKERRSYIVQNGINIYGAVVTGPVPELRKLEQVKEIRAMKVGEVKLWN